MGKYVETLSIISTMLRGWPNRNIIFNKVFNIFKSIEFTLQSLLLHFSYLQSFSTETRNSLQHPPSEWPPHQCSLINRRFTGIPPTSLRSNGFQCESVELNWVIESSFSGFTRETLFRARCLSKPALCPSVQLLEKNIINPLPGAALLASVWRQEERGWKGGRFIFTQVEKI